MGGLRQKRGQRKPHHSKSVQSKRRRYGHVRYDGGGRNKPDGKDRHKNTPPTHNRWRQLGFMCANNIKTLSSFSSVISLHGTKAGKHVTVMSIFYWFMLLPTLAFAFLEFRVKYVILTIVGGVVCLVIGLKCYIDYAYYYGSKKNP